jgi:hypothetical protein
LPHHGAPFAAASERDRAATLCDLCCGTLLPDDVISLPLSPRHPPLLLSRGAWTDSVTLPQGNMVIYEPAGIFCTLSLPVFHGSCSTLPVSRHCHFPSLSFTSSQVIFLVIVPLSQASAGSSTPGESANPFPAVCRAVEIRLPAELDLGNVWPRSASVLSMAWPVEPRVLRTCQRRTTIVVRGMRFHGAPLAWLPLGGMRCLACAVLLGVQLARTSMLESSACQKQTRCDRRGCGTTAVST